MLSLIKNTMNLEAAFQDYLPDWFENRRDEQKEQFWKSKTVLFEWWVGNLWVLSDKELADILNSPISELLPFGHNKDLSNQQ